MEYYAFHIGDWKGATDHLSLEEEAIYLRLMNLYYDTEAPLSGDVAQIARRIRARDQVATVNDVLLEFFDPVNEGWQHNRIDGELAKFHDRVEKARAAGRASGRSRRNERPLNARSSRVEPPNTQDPKPSTVPDKQERPAWLNATAWDEFEQHRKEIRHPLTDLARKKAMKQLEGLTLEQQASCIDNTIQNRWRGLFPEKIVADQGGKRNGKLVLPRDDEKLWDFAKQHGLPAPGQLTYKQYRSRLEREIDKRSNQ